VDLDRVVDAGVLEQVALLRGRELAAAELLSACLDRARRPRGEAGFVALEPERARRHADLADRRLAAGERAPLLGVPIALEDHRRSAGAAGRSAVDALEERVLLAGAVVVGRTVAGPAAQRPPVELTLRGRPEPVPGTATAVALGVVSAGLAHAGPAGEPAAGPAGLAWYRPGCAPGATGPGAPAPAVIARRVADAGFVLDGLAGPGQPGPVAGGPLRISVSLRGLGWHGPLQPAARRAVEDAAATLSLYGHQVADADFGRRPLLRAAGLLVGRYLRGPGALREAAAELVGDADVLLVPEPVGICDGLALPGPRRDRVLVLRPGSSALLRPLWLTTGYPTVAVPVGGDSQREPQAVRLIGAPHAERALLALAELIEAAPPAGPGRRVA
jgi:amidase